MDTKAIWEIAELFEEFFYATFGIFYVLGIVLTFAVPIVVLIFWKRIMPKVLRTLFWAFRRRQPLLLLCHDSGRSILTTIIERQGEGIVMTQQSKYKILPRFAPKKPFSELFKEMIKKRMLAAQMPKLENGNGNGSPEGEEPEIPQLEEEMAEETEVLPELDWSKALSLKALQEHFIFDYSEYTNKRSILIGLDLPVFVGYTGKLCLLNPEALALYESGDMQVKTSEEPMFNPMGVNGKTIEESYQPLLLLNPRKIQEIIWKGFDQSQIAGVVADSEEYVRTQMQGGLSPTMKYILILGLLAAGAVAAVLFLPQILGGQPMMIGNLLSRLLG